MEYVEGGKSLHVDSEAQAIPAFVVYAQSRPADAGTSVIDNLRRAWRSSGFDIQFQQ
jgi:hypothetical protein